MMRNVAIDGWTVVRCLAAVFVTALATGQLLAQTAETNPTRSANDRMLEGGPEAARLRICAMANAMCTAKGRGGCVRP